MAFELFKGEWYDLYNGDCLEVMRTLPDSSVDIVITSPPYNTCRKGTIADCKDVKGRYDKRYDQFIEAKTTEEYVQWTVDLFKEFDRLLRPNCPVLYNYGMGTDSQTGACIDDWWLVIPAVIAKSNFSCADMLFWKKNCALPNNMSPNKSTRIVEPVMVMARKNETGTFLANKKHANTRRSGQKTYTPFANLFWSPNNDECTDVNKATFSVRFVRQLMDWYVPDSHGDDYTALDPFNGTGTTGRACQERGIKYVGIELSNDQCRHTIKRFGESFEKYDPTAKADTLAVFVDNEPAGTQELLF